MKQLFFILLFYSYAAGAQNVFVSPSGGDDGPALKAAFAKAGQIHMAAGTYTTNIRLTVPPNTTVFGNKAKIKTGPTFPTTRGPVITTPVIVTKQASGLSISVTKGSKTFQYSGASTLTVGSMMALYGGVYYTRGTDNYNAGWYSRIAAISGTTVTLEHAAPMNFTATSLTQRRPNVNIHILDLEVERGKGDGYGIELQYVLASTIKRCIAHSDPDGGMRNGLRLDGIDCSVSYCFVYNTDMTDTYKGGGIHIQGQNDTAKFNRVINARGGIASSGRTYISENIIYEDNEIDTRNYGTGLDFHANVSGIIRRNKIWMAPNPGDAKIHAMHGRRGGTTIENNEVYFLNFGYMVYQMELGYTDMTIRNNTGYYQGMKPEAVVRNTEMPGQVNYINTNNILIAGTIPARPPSRIMTESGEAPPPVVVVPPAPAPPPPVVAEGEEDCNCWIKIGFDGKRKN